MMGTSDDDKSMCAEYIMGAIAAFQAGQWRQMHLYLDLATSRAVSVLVESVRAETCEAMIRAIAPGDTSERAA